MVKKFKIIQNSGNYVTFSPEFSNKTIWKKGNPISQIGYKKIKKRIDGYGIAKGAKSFKEEKEEHKEFWINRFYYLSKAKRIKL